MCVCVSVCLCVSERACIKCCLPSCVCTTTHSRFVTAHAGTLPNLWDTKEERGASCYIIEHAHVCCLRRHVRSLLCTCLCFATKKLTHEAHSSVVLIAASPLPCCLLSVGLFTSSLPFFAYLDSVCTLAAQTHITPSHTHTKVSHSAKLQGLWHLLHYSWVQIRVHEIIMNRAHVHKGIWS